MKAYERNVAAAVWPSTFEVFRSKAFSVAGKFKLDNLDNNCGKKRRLTRSTHTG